MKIKCRLLKNWLDDELSPAGCFTGSIRQVHPPVHLIGFLYRIINYYYFIFLGQQRNRLIRTATYPCALVSDTLLCLTQQTAFLICQIRCWQWFVLLKWNCRDSPSVCFFVSSKIWTISLSCFCLLCRGLVLYVEYSCRASLWGWRSVELQLQH